MMLEVYNRNNLRVAYLENAFEIKEDKKLNSLSYLNFKMPGNDPKNRFCLAFNYIKIDSRLYRILPNTLSIEDVSIITYECEHVLATLIDKIIFGHVVIGNLGTYTNQVINWVLSKQDKWVLETCEISRQFEYGFEQENLLSALWGILKPITNPFILEFNTNVFPWRLRIKNFNTNKLPELYIRTNKNLLKLVRTSDPKNIVTRIYPLGYGEGVNQLGIKEINGGIPYLQSPKQFTDEYGIIERAWIDRRYEHAESLKSAAQAMLNELQEPQVEYEVDYYQVGSENFDKAEIGKIVMIVDNETNIKYKTYITGIYVDYDDIERSKIFVSNKPKDIAGTIAEMADRQRVEMAYSQGATQLYGQSLQANCSSSEGAQMNFFIPQEMRIINKVIAKIRLESFRAYSKSTTGGGGYFNTTEAGGGTFSSTESGGGDFGSTLSGGGEYGSTLAGGGNYVSTGVERYLGGRGHNHGVSQDIRLATIKAYTKEGIDFGEVRMVQSGDHEHSFNMPYHAHLFQIDPHSHEFRISSHIHSFNLSPHNHPINIPAHDHDITPGIFRFGFPKSFSLYVNGKLKQTFNTTNLEIDLTPHLLNERGTIERGLWQSVEIRPNDLAYAIIDLYVQGFIQSRGDRAI